MTYHQAIVPFLLSCGVVLLVGCSKPAKQEYEQPEQHTLAQVEPATTEAAEEEFTVPENGIYEEEVEPEQSTDSSSQHLTDYDLKELMQRHAQNPAAVEADLFRMQARVVEVKTDTDSNGERIAVVRLVHPQLNVDGKYNSAYQLSISFFCLTKLQEAAYYQRDDVVTVVGQIVDTGENVLFYHDGKPITSKYMHAVCKTES